MRQLTRGLLQGLLLICLLALTTTVTRWLLVPRQEPGAALPASATATSGATSSPLPPTLPPTATATATVTSSPSPSPSPSATPAPPTLVHATPVLTMPINGTSFPISVPTPAPPVELPRGTINILLLGADNREVAGSCRWLTDVMVVVSVHPDGPSVSMLSIPRDFYAWIPGYGFDRLNAAVYRGEETRYPGGGLALIKATIEYNLGIPIHYYALVGFEGFVHTVDTLGGVNVPVECELHDIFPNPNNPEEGIDVDFMPGVQHLDGYHTLWYVRSRWSTHDFDRNRRQQQVLRALYRQALDLDILPRIPELWDVLQQTVQTDLGLDELLYLGMIGGQLDWSNVKSRFITPPFVTPATSPTGAYILLPVPDALESLVAEALLPPAEGRARQTPFRVEIWDGTGVAGMSEVAAERLRWEGFEVVGTSASSQIYPRTQIVDFTTTSKGSPLPLLQRLYKRSADDVTSQPTEGGPVDFRVMLGADYDPCVSNVAVQYVPTPTSTPTPSPNP